MKTTTKKKITETQSDNVVPFAGTTKKTKSEGTQGKLSYVEQMLASSKDSSKATKSKAAKKASVEEKAAEWLVPTYEESENSPVVEIEQRKKRKHRVYVTTEEYKQELIYQGRTDLVPIGEYTRSVDKLLHKCTNPECGKEWSCSPNTIKLGAKCPVCKGLKPGERIRPQCTTEEYKQDLIARGCDGLVPIEDYTRSSDKILHKCTNKSCGNEWKISPNSAKSGTKCPVCKGLLPEEQDALANENYVQLLRKQGATNFIPVGVYKNHMAPLEHKCVLCDYVFTNIPKNILYSNNKCPNCKCRGGVDSNGYKGTATDVKNQHNVLKAKNETEVSAALDNQVSMFGKRYRKLCQELDKKGSSDFDDQQSVAMIQSLLFSTTSMIEIAEKAYRQFRNERSAYAFKALVEQNLQLLQDLRIMRGNDKVVEKVVEQLKTHVTTIVQHLIDGSYLLKKQLMDATSSERVKKEIEKRVQEHLTTQGKSLNEVFKAMEASVVSTLSTGSKR